MGCYCQKLTIKTNGGHETTPIYYILTKHNKNTQPAIAGNQHKYVDHLKRTENSLRGSLLPKF
jgi:hypothetical protein